MFTHPQRQCRLSLLELHHIRIADLDSLLLSKTLLLLVAVGMGLVTPLILTQVEEGCQAKMVQVIKEEMAMDITKEVVEMDLVVGLEVEEEQVEVEEMDFQMVVAVVDFHHHILATTMTATVLLHRIMLRAEAEAAGGGHVNEQ